MEIIKYTGCTSNATYIDNVNIKDLGESEKKIAAKKVLTYIIDNDFSEIDLDYFIDEMLETIKHNMADYHISDKPCEQCGDYSEKIIIQV